MSVPTIAWLTNGTRRQLEAYARAEGMPLEEAAGELVCDRLRELKVPPAPDPVSPPSILRPVLPVEPAPMLPPAPPPLAPAAGYRPRTLSKPRLR